ncbi:unnamed protein product, partial [marine sediment metagenome]
DPQSTPEEIIEVPLETDIFYEPWFMDRGSLLFHPPKSMVGMQGQLLKLSVFELEPVEVFKD